MFIKDAYEIIDYEMECLGITWARRIDGNTIKFRHYNKWSPVLCLPCVIKAFGEIRDLCEKPDDNEGLWKFIISDSDLRA